MKQVVVPYTLGLINHIVTQRGKQIDYYKIWKAQSVSEELSQFIYDLMVEVTKNKKNIIAAVRNSAIRIYEIVCANNIELLLEADTLTANAAAEQETPITNTAFWRNKIEYNRARDQKNYDILINAGWQVIVLWQCKLTKQDLETTLQSVVVALNQNLLRSI